MSLFRLVETSQNGSALRLLEMEKPKELSSQFLYSCFLTSGPIQDMVVSLNKTPQHNIDPKILYIYIYTLTLGTPPKKVPLTLGKKNPIPI